MNCTFPAGAIALGLVMTGSRAQGVSPADPSVFGEFVGSTPCGEVIRQLLRIPSNAESDLIRWKLTLYQDEKTRAPSRYGLRCEYGLTSPGKPGLAGDATTLERQGTWRTRKGTKSNAEAIVHELTGAVSLFEVDANVLQVLNPDGSLMIGNGGWSYTLNRADHAEKPVDEALAVSQPEMSYQISPVATGPTVFGVFEGRTPCQGIARELRIPVSAASTKTKWRVTLHQNSETHAPTTFKMEGSLFRRGAREGTWSIRRGTEADANAVTYRLAPTEAQPAVFLLKGDENVLFFLSQNQRPLVGHDEFSYTLNRRIATPAGK